MTLLHQAYQDECLECCMILRWYHAFVEGRDSAELTPHGRRLATVTSPINMNMVSIMIKEDHHLSTKKIDGLLNTTQSSVNQILLQHLQMQRVLSMWVPHLPICKQVDTRLHLCEEALQQIAEDPEYLNRVIMEDESWVHHHDPLSRQESSH